MKQNLLNLAFCMAVTILVLTAAVGILSEPQTDREDWFAVLVVTKGIGFTAAYAVYLIIKKVTKAVREQKNEQ